MSARLDLPQGTLDLLILKSLSLGPQHGWAISERIHEVSRATLQIPQGSLYPALHRLENAGLLKGTWAPTSTGRDAKFYKLTAKGQKRLESDVAEWKELSMAIAMVLGTPRTT